MNNQQHEMILTKVYPSGAEEWFCPECGRRFIMQWPPVYKKVILNLGDENAIHSGGRGGAESGLYGGASQDTGSSRESGGHIYGTGGAPGFSKDEEPGMTENNPAGNDDIIDEQRSLEPWLEWMERVNFDSLWRE